MSEMPAVRGVRPVQIALFPGPRAERASIAQIHAVSRPARTFTGDFFLTHRHDEHLWFALGDVAGKGLDSAVFMAMIQEELEHRIASCAATACDPAATTERLDAFLKPVIPPNRFATLVLGHVGLDGKLTISNAGHCPALVLRTDGSIDEIGSTGPAAGILPGARWRSRTASLQSGDALILYSDGVIESLTPAGELGVDGLRSIVASAEDRTAGGIAATILSGLGKVSDDVTLLVMTKD